MEGETSQFVENHVVSASKFRSTCRTLTNILSSLSLMLCSLLLFPRTHAISGEGFRCEWLLTFDHEVWKWLGLIRVPRWSGGHPQTRFFYPIVQDSMLDLLCYGSTWTYTIHFFVRAPGMVYINSPPCIFQEEFDSPTARISIAFTIWCVWRSLNSKSHESKVHR